MSKALPIARGRKFQQVLEGARAIFLRDGFEGASVDDIAREAGRKIAFTLSAEFVIDRHRAAFHELIAAYGAVRARSEQKTYRPKPRAVMSIEAARQRLADLLGEMPPWSDLLAYLPPELAPDLARAAQRAGGEQRVHRHHPAIAIDQRRHRAQGHRHVAGLAQPAPGT